MVWGIVFGSLALLIIAGILLCFFVSKKDFKRVKFNYNDNFFNLKLFNEKKFNLCNEIVALYKSYSVDKKEIGSLIDEIDDIDIDINVENMRQFFLNEALLNKKLKMVQFLIGNNVNAQSDKQFEELINIANSVEAQVKSAKRYYSLVVSRYNKKMDKFFSKTVAKICKFEKLPTIEELTVKFNIL